MKKLLTVFLFIFAVSFMAAPAYSASPWVDEDTYGDKVVHKLGFGLKNVVLGWTEIFTQPSAAGEGKVLGAMVNGIKDATIYTVGGLLHVATFPIPVDIALPNDGVQVQHGVNVKL